MRIPPGRPRRSLSRRGFGRGIRHRRSATIPGMSRRADPALTERRRAQLIRAGYTEILEKGIQHVTLDSVVARAGSSKGGALHYFRTKEDLLFAVLEWLLTQVDRTLDD